MPTIEIVSLGAKEKILQQSDFEVAIIEEEKLISHRGLFSDFLKQHKGIMVHIGNPDFREDKDGFFFAGMIIKRDKNHKFRFEQKYQSEIAKIIEICLQNSPKKEAYFLTDYQFGPKKGKFKDSIGIKDFWLLHDNEGLERNTLYRLK